MSDTVIGVCAKLINATIRFPLPPPEVKTEYHTEMPHAAVLAGDRKIVVPQVTTLAAHAQAPPHSAAQQPQQISLVGAHILEPLLNGGGGGGGQQPKNAFGRQQQ